MNQIGFDRNGIHRGRTSAKPYIESNMFVFMSHLFEAAKVHNKTAIQTKSIVFSESRCTWKISRIFAANPRCNEIKPIKMKKLLFLILLALIMPFRSAIAQAKRSESFKECYTLKQVVVLSRHNIRSPLSGRHSTLQRITPRMVSLVVGTQRTIVARRSIGNNDGTVFPQMADGRGHDERK